MELLPGRIRKELVRNFKVQIAAGRIHENLDFEPVVKLFTPDARASWLLCELDERTNIAFGLCDLGLGFPEVGYVSLDEVAAVHGNMGLPIERDLHFKAQGTLSEYADAARAAGRIIQLDEWQQEMGEDEFSR